MEKASSEAFPDVFERYWLSKSSKSSNPSRNMLAVHPSSWPGQEKEDQMQMLLQECGTKIFLPSRSVGCWFTCLTMQLFQTTSTLVRFVCSLRQKPQQAAEIAHRH